MGSTAQAGSVLFVNISGSSYNGDANSINQTLINTGATVNYVTLSGGGGQAAAALATASYDQVWVFDLSTGSDSYAADYDAIAAWYNTDKEIICDGRMISSYWSGRWTGEGQRLTDNYYHNMDIRGGGLVIGTDHNAFHTLGANDINSRIGLDPFVGNFSTAMIPVDTANPLMTTPNDMGTQLYDDSSPGQTPYGLQSNGQILYTLAWHSGNPDWPGISSTIEGDIGFHVDIDTPLDGSVFDIGDTINLFASPDGGESPFTYQWSYDGGTSLGSGQSLSVSAGTLGLGPHTITVLAEDLAGRDDDDSISITVESGGPPPIPEPLTMLAVGLSVAGLGGYIRRRRFC